MTTQGSQPVLDRIIDWQNRRRADDMGTGYSYPLTRDDYHLLCEELGCAHGELEKINGTRFDIIGHHSTESD